MDILRPRARLAVISLAAYLALVGSGIALGTTLARPAQPATPRTASFNLVGLDLTHLAKATRRDAARAFLAAHKPHPVVPRRPAHPVAPHVSQQPSAPVGSVKARVIAAWPGDDNWVVRTVACESGFDPQQVGGGGNNYYGLFQFGPWARAHYGNPLNMSVEGQTAAAWALIKAAGSQQWECSPYPYHP